MKNLTTEIEYSVELFDRTKYNRVFQRMKESIMNVFQADDGAEDTELTSYQALKQGVLLSEKTTLTLEEAAVYSGIGIHKLRKITNASGCKFVLWNGSKRLIKRRLLDEYLEKSDSI